MVKVTVSDGKATVESPYNHEFVARARRLGGKWNNNRWVFDVRDEQAVREVCVLCYGTDGVIKDTVDVRVTILGYDSALGGDAAPLVLFGRTIARALGRDSGAVIGDGVVVEKGGFFSGGSHKNWRTMVESGTVIVMRDVSRQLVEAWESDSTQVEVLPSEQIDRDALVAERERLMGRIREIDAALSGMDSVSSLRMRKVNV